MTWWRLRERSDLQLTVVRPRERIPTHCIGNSRFSTHCVGNLRKRTKKTNVIIQILGFKSLTITSSQIVCQLRHYTFTILSTLSTTQLFTSNSLAQMPVADGECVVDYSYPRLCSFNIRFCFARELSCAHDWECKGTKKFWDNKIIRTTAGGLLFKII